MSWQISFLNPANYCLLWFVNEPLECLNLFIQVLFGITFCLFPFFLKSYLKVLYSDVLFLLLLMIFQNSSPRSTFFLFSLYMWFFVSLSVHFSYFLRIKIILLQQYLTMEIFSWSILKLQIFIVFYTTLLFYRFFKKIFNWNSVNFLLSFVSSLAQDLFFSLLSELSSTWLRRD